MKDVVPLATTKKHRRLGKLLCHMFGRGNLYGPKTKTHERKRTYGSKFNLLKGRCSKESEERSGAVCALTFEADVMGF